jgi:hypothetical protein
MQLLLDCWTVDFFNTNEKSPKRERPGDEILKVYIDLNLIHFFALFFDFFAGNVIIVIH